MSITSLLKDNLAKISRSQKLDCFYSHCQEGSTILDVGVSSEKKEGLSTRNYFLKNFRYSDKYYTGLGVQDLSDMEQRFPGKHFVQYSGGRFPFKDREFDWVFCNAVIEHVGDEDAQLLFLNEMLRVATKVFFTTPNKFFPIESHTNLLFVHWNDDIFYKWKKWNKNDLYLFSYQRLLKLLSKSNSSRYTILKNRFIGITMTFTAICQ
jgi:SAM-dependent methyltransferase